MKNIRGILLSLLSVPLLVGCAPPWQVVRMAEPNPFLGKTAYVTEALHFEQLSVGGKPDAIYTQGKTPEQQASWAADKAGMNDDFDKSLVEHSEGLTVAAAPAPPPPGAFVVRPAVTFVEPGAVIGPYGGRIKTEVDLAVQLLDPSGATVLDEFTTRVWVDATIFNPSTGGRVRSASKHLGDIVARYLRNRAGIQK